MNHELDIDTVQRVIQAAGLPDGVDVRPWTEEDFPAIQRLSLAEGWPTPVDRPADALHAWSHSSPALVAVADGEVIGFLRAMSDGAVTTYVAEILVSPGWQGRGVGSTLLAIAQLLCPGTRLDVLATEQSRTFYERAGFGPFHGYRRRWRDVDAAYRPM